MTIARVVVVSISILLVNYRIGAQCEPEDSALDSCLDGAGVGGGGKLFCGLCIGASVTAASVANTTCDDLSSQDSGLCTSLSLCVTCSTECSSEQQAYALCEFNDDANKTCTTLSCDSPSPATTGPPTTSPPATGFPTRTPPCEAEDSAMDVCMNAAGTSAAGKTACDLCIGASATGASVAGTACEDLTSQDSGLCTALALCPGCPDECFNEQQAYALCEFNDSANTTCTTLSCDITNSPTVGPPTGPPTTGLPTSAPPCQAEDSAMDSCMDAAGVSGAGKMICLLCMGTSVASASSANTTCEDLSSPDNGFCTALARCPACPEECGSEQQAYALCEFNNDASKACSTLLCNSTIPSSTGAPTTTIPSSTGAPTTEPLMASPQPTGSPSSAPTTTERSTSGSPTGPPTAESPIKEDPSSSSPPPSDAPSSLPSASPTKTPTMEAPSSSSPAPSVVPSAVPSGVSSDVVSESLIPSNEPSTEPISSTAPSNEPSAEPSASLSPSAAPSDFSSSTRAYLSHYSIWKTLILGYIMSVALVMIFKM